MDMFLDELFRRENDAAEAASLAVDMFGGGIDHAISAELERALPQRRRKDVVDHKRGARAMRDLRHFLQVNHLERRVGRRFKEEGFGIGPHRRAPLREIGPVHERASDAKARQQILHHITAGAEQRPGGDDMVAGPHLSHHRGGNGGHAACGRARGLSAFEGGHARFEHRNGGIGKAGIEIARLLALEARFASLGGVVNEALGEEQGFRGFAELRALAAGLHKAGFRAVFAIGRRGHAGLLLACA